MNRQKKLRQKVTARLKKARAKLNPNKKEPYISKAERQKIAEQEQSAAVENNPSH
ncbi:DUF2986 domain-containing protein [Thiomicrorhabdus sediminis]|uniref:DUF2986 domain-containing protein n=1 Tax=Thiomicrorhabdus sediminis TaxID=2580412 RepID=A0A4P9K7S9_9GAMM|nr:DUF2986 domain-containing protein [Thiomicrorhabdus sediminis]QCU90297.1 DUF2986 domain-containing protein [Thiomicrorhabdus sediminis]